MNRCSSISHVHYYSKMRQMGGYQKIRAKGLPQTSWLFKTTNRHFLLGSGKRARGHDLRWCIDGCPPSFLCQQTRHSRVHCSFSTEWWWRKSVNKFAANGKQWWWRWSSSRGIAAFESLGSNDTWVWYWRHCPKKVVSVMWKECCKPHVHVWVPVGASPSLIAGFEKISLVIGNYSSLGP